MPIRIWLTCGGGASTTSGPASALIMIRSPSGSTAGRHGREGALDAAAQAASTRAVGRDHVPLHSVAMMLLPFRSGHRGGGERAREVGNRLLKNSPRPGDVKGILSP